MKISIITVCYNSVATLETAIESVLGQTYQDIEYIVVDGGSTDGTVEILRGYAGRSSKVGDASRQFIWISEPDEGMYDAINKGIRMATGDVVGILNADDVLSADDVIERVAQVFGGSASVDALYGDIRFITNRRGVGLAGIRAEKTKRYYSSRHWRPWMLQWGFMPPHPSVYIRKECFMRLGDYALNYRIAADNELLIRFFRIARLYGVYVPLCFVDMRLGGMSTRNWRSNVLLNQEIIRGNRENGYFCCMLMLIPKYFFKIFEFVIPWLKH
jgi:glycosyltransferase involved in cell wall biosynthesis